MTVVFLILAGFFGWLAFERRTLTRRRARIPVRICVTGTRGKSTVTRQIAAALRASGRKVLAKTTGSKPVLILPDGSEREIRRPGTPSVLEQKRVLGLAARLGADALVAEMMSIGPECLAVESGRIFQPSVLVLTNVRLDHEEEMGGTVEAVARSLSAAISPGSTIFIPAAERYPVFDARVRHTGGRILSPTSASGEPAASGLDFPENLQLSLSVAEHLGIDSKTAFEGISRARPDFGGLRAFQIDSPISGRAWRFISLFAANEPESTALAMDRVRACLPFQGRRAIVLLNLRPDRASRTRRWLEAVSEGFFSGFDRVVFIGEQASALGRKRFPGGKTCASIRAQSAERVMAELWPMSGEETVVVGAGNIAGIGRELVELWEKKGATIAC